ncbi:hypothetical protein D3C85_1541040 [compost metagenome]
MFTEVLARGSSMVPSGSTSWLPLSELAAGKARPTVSPDWMRYDADPLVLMWKITSSTSCGRSTCSLRGNSASWALAGAAVMICTGICRVS